VTTELTAGGLILASPHPAPDLLWSPIGGRPLLAWSVAACVGTPAIAETLLLVPPERLDDARALADAERWARVRIVAGSARLRESVAAGLSALDPALRWAVIHEAARPLATPAQFTAALDLARATGDDVTTGEPVKETVKRVRDGLVVETLPRERMARAQTPYVFQRERLVAANASLLPERDYSDVVKLALAAGLPLRIVPGSPDNLRVTSAAELAVAAALLAARSS
jgi:2-C-methyl-D-erythritol 4-phosphate cytidylyltransferase